MSSTSSASVRPSVRPMVAASGLNFVPSLREKVPFVLDPSKEIPIIDRVAAAPAVSLALSLISISHDAPPKPTLRRRRLHSTPGRFQKLSLRREQCQCSSALIELGFLSYMYIYICTTLPPCCGGAVVHNFLIGTAPVKDLLADRQALL